MRILSVFLFLSLTLFVTLSEAQALPNNKCEAALAGTPTLADKLKTLGLRAKIEKTELKKTDNLRDDEDRYLLTISFGKLTQSQFNELHRYMGGESKVTFDKDRFYEMIDFLSPLQQALINKTFHSYSLVPSWGGDREFKNEGTKWNLKNGVEVFSNCWNTAWEVTRCNYPNNQDENYYLYWPGRWEADSVLKNQENSVLVEEAHIQNGDMLIVSAGGSMAPGAMIQHAALFVTPDILFEKSNGSKDDSFRLSFAKDVIQKYKKIFAENFDLEIRRFNQPGQKQLAVPNLKDDDVDHEIVKEIREIPGMEKHPGPLHFGAEVGLGGGNSSAITGILIFQVKIDPKTGRGVLDGQPQDLAHFKKIK